MGDRDVHPKAVTSRFPLFLSKGDFMKKKLENLIDLKSIITILLVVTLVFLTIGNMSIDDETIKTLYISVTTSCFTYYFTKKKNEDNK